MQCLGLALIAAASWGNPKTAGAAQSEITQPSQPAGLSNSARMTRPAEVTDSVSSPATITQETALTVPAAATSETIQPYLPPEPVLGAGEVPNLADSIAIHAFVSQGYIKSTANNYLLHSNRGSFRFSEVGINFSKPLSERLSVGLQLFGESIGPRGNFEIRADWFKLDYHFTDYLGIRVGRTKLPFGLYNEVNDIDAARVPILLPQSVYPLGNRDFLLAQSGAEAYGDIDLHAWGTAGYRLYGGTIDLNIENDPTSPTRVGDLFVPYIAGGRVMWRTPVDGLLIGGSLQTLRLEADLFFPPAPTATVIELPALLWIGSAKYTLGDVELTTEYSRWHVRVRSSAPALFPESSAVSERMYAMATYRFSDWLQSGVYYSLLFPDIGDRTGRESRQDDTAATLRFDINRYWLLKLEGHLMSGTAGLTSSLNEGRPLSSLEKRWGVFLLKTTAYF